MEKDDVLTNAEETAFAFLIIQNKAKDTCCWGPSLSMGGFVRSPPASRAFLFWPWHGQTALFCKSWQTVGTCERTPTVTTEVGRDLGMAWRGPRRRWAHSHENFSCKAEEARFCLLARARSHANPSLPLSGPGTTGPTTSSRQTVGKGGPDVITEAR